MKTFIVPENIGAGIRAFFTGKNPGADIERIGEILSMQRQKIYLPIQKHTDKVHLLDADLEPVVADAIVTNRRGVLIGVQVADCAPILLYDRKKHVIAAVHAGWRGTAQGILKNTINVMADRFYSDVSDINVAVGPSIRWCCYEVGHEVIDAVEKAVGSARSHEKYYMQKGDKYCLDLQSANRMQAINMGILENNIWMSEECTYCFPDKYYSYRYSKGTTGRQGGFIGLLSD